MEPPSELTDPGPKLPEERSPEASLLSRLDREELESRLRVTLRKEKRHLLWMVLGISPAAVIPAIGLLREGSLGLLVILGVLVSMTQWVSWTKASREAESIEKRLNRLPKGE